jgi:hypothetical protein
LGDVLKKPLSDDLMFSVCDCVLFLLREGELFAKLNGKLSIVLAPNIMAKLKEICRNNLSVSVTATQISLLMLLNAIIGMISSFLSILR